VYELQRCSDLALAVDELATPALLLLLILNPVQSIPVLTLGTNDGMVFSYVAMIGPALMGQLRNLHRFCVCVATSMPAQLIFTVTSPPVTSAPVAFASKHWNAAGAGTAGKCSITCEGEQLLVPARYLTRWLRMSSDMWRCWLAAALQAS
jgi:hypothetical protein